VENFNLINGDCLIEMQNIPDGSIDAIITDLPYGTTACKWDSVIDFDLMWEQLNRIIKPNGAIVLFGSEPFSSALRMSNIKNYKYDWYWDKVNSGNFVQAKRMPLKNIECISVFSNGGKMPDYYPKMILRDNPIMQGGTKTSHAIPIKNNEKTHTKKTYTHKYPKTLLYYPKSNRKGSYHPTQKPVPLMEYLIKTYTNENEIVLDMTMGSGSTGVACKNTNRNFIGIEQDERYFEIAKKRIKDAQSQPELF